MSRSRRDFIAQSSLGLLGAAIAPQVSAQTPAQTPATPQAQTPGAPTVFGTAPPVGPKVSAETFVEAGKLMQIEMKPADLAEAAGNWQQAMAPVYERRVGPRKLAITDADVPATVWNPSLGAVNERNIVVDAVFSAVPPQHGLYLRATRISPLARSRICRGGSKPGS